MTAEVVEIGRPPKGGLVVRMNFNEIEEGSEQIEHVYSALVNCHTVTARLALANAASFLLFPLICLAVGAVYGSLGVLFLNIYQLHGWFTSLRKALLNKATSVATRAGLHPTPEPATHGEQKYLEMLDIPW
jgi:hypothetical protein